MSNASASADINLVGDEGQDVTTPLKSGKGNGNGSEGVSAPAKAVLKFSTPRDPVALAAFINLRVLNPENEHWRRGVEAAVIYARAHGDLRVPFTFRVPAAEDVRLVRAEFDGSAPPWSPAGPDGGYAADERLEGEAVVHVRAGHGDGERDALGIGQHVQLAARRTR